MSQTTGHRDPSGPRSRATAPVPRTRRMAGSITIAVMFAAVAGCATTGLSNRERAGRDYSHYVYSLYDAPAGAAERGGLLAPARLTVAQVGEVAPPPAMIETLRQQGDLFADVQGVPAAMQIDERREATDPGQARQQMSRLVHLSRDMGADYLLVLGGTIDYGQASTPLSALDITIVGAYVVPSREMTASGKASAALIDLRSNRVVLLTTTAAQGQRLDSAVGAEGGRHKLVASVRDQLVDTLAANFIEEYRRSHGAGAGTRAGG
jgi:hypothetical protein